MSDRKFIEVGKHRFNIDNPCRQQIVEMLCEVIADTMQVFDFGAKKHPDSGDTPNFLTPEGNKCELKVRGKSALGHVAKAFEAPGALDDESRLPHLLHAVSSLAIMYIRHKRNIVHPNDQQESKMRIGEWIILEKDDSIRMRAKIAMMEKQILQLIEELRKDREVMRKHIKGN